MFSLGHAQRVQVEGTKLEICYAGGRPHSPVAHYGVGVWLPPVFLGKMFISAAQREPFPLEKPAGAGLGSAPRKGCFS